MGASTARPPDSSYSSMGIRRPGIEKSGSSGIQSPSKEVRPDTTRPGIKFGPGQSTRFD